jgi:alpha-L-fucosidase
MTIRNGRAIVVATAMAALATSAAAGQPYTSDWKSLEAYEIPEWMADAKFGIFIHWGPSCVPGFSTDWYPRWMYLDKVQQDHITGAVTSRKPHKAHVYHVKTFGDLTEFGYKDFIPRFKAGAFDASDWVDLFVKSGARYVIPVAEHHDSYAMYDSSITRWNSVDTGPKRDFLAELREEIKKQGLIFGASSHLAFNWDFYPQNPKYDTNDSEYSDLYAPQHAPYSEVAAEFLETWWLRTKEIIDNYEPDILWLDFGIDRAEWVPYHAKLAAYYYNSGLRRGVTPVLQTKNLKYDSYPTGTHMLDLERSKSDQMLDELWQTDTSIGSNSWFHCREWISKSSKSLIGDLVDIVSKNGCLLLNVGPDPQGRIPEDQQQVLLEMGQWLAVNGEAIYGTRPWKTFGEGPTKVATGHLSEGKNKAFTQADIRFTQKENTLYAIILQAPESETLIRSLNASLHPELEKIKSISILGSEQKLDWVMTDQGLQIGKIDKPPFESAVALKIELGK